MHDEAKKYLIVAGTAIGGLLLLVLAGYLGWTIISAMSSAIIKSVEWMGGFISFCIITFVVFVMGILAVLSPILVGFLCVTLIVSLMELISRKAESLYVEITKLLGDSSRDAIFLAIIALMAGLSFYMVTEDFLRGLTTLKLITVAATVSSIAKMLMLVPTRVVKWAGLIMTSLTLIGLAFFIMDRYHIVSSAGVSLSGIPIAWKGQEEARSKLLWLVALTTDLLLLFVAVSYPFTLKGWKRVWRSVD